MWHLGTTTMPVIVRVLGMIEKGTDKHINNIPGYASLYEIQKIAFCGTAHLFGRELSIWLKNITKRGNQIHKYIEYI